AFRTAPLEVAKVFGRSAACSETSADFIGVVSVSAIHAGISPKILAATIAVESGCNPLAVPNRGAIGLTQVVPKVWSKQFDFSKVNLLNGQENLKVGSTILSQLIREHGLADGVRRYNGLGVDCETCDAG